MIISETNDEDVTPKSRLANTQLIAAAYRGQCNRLLDTMAYSDFVFSGVEAAASSAALLIAVARGRSDVVKALLDSGVDVNAIDGAGQTALHYAARLKTLPMMRVLISKGANVNARDDDGWTPLTSTTSFQDAELSRVLLDAGGDPDITAHNGLSELYDAATSGDVEYVKFLLDIGTGPWIRTRPGWTPFHWAGANGHEEIVRMLIEASEGVGMNFISDQNVTPLDLAMKHHQTKISTMLAQAGGICGEHVLRNPSLVGGVTAVQHKYSMQPVADGKKVFLMFDELALTPEMRYGVSLYQPEDNGRVYHLSTYLNDASSTSLKICLANAPGMPREYHGPSNASGESRITFTEPLFEVRRSGHKCREFSIQGGALNEQATPTIVNKSKSGGWKAYQISGNDCELFFKIVPDWTVQHARVAAGKRIRFIDAEGKLLARMGWLNSVPCASLEGHMSLEMQHLFVSCWVAILWSDTLVRTGMVKP